MYGRINMRHKYNRIGFGSHAESVTLWLQVTPLSMDKNGHPMLNEWMTQLIHTNCVITAYKLICLSYESDESVWQLSNPRQLILTAVKSSTIGSDSCQILDNSGGELIG